MQDIYIEWKGNEYCIPHNKVMGTIAKVESVVTLSELHEYINSNKIPYSKLAAAYAIFLRQAGADASDAEVYEAIFTGDLNDSPVDILYGLVTLMLPPSAIQAQEDKEQSGAKKKTTAKKTTAKKTATKKESS